jgi:serine/threonine protein kinase
MDKLITCPTCGSDFCYEVEQEQKKLWHCFGCGFASNSNQHIETVDLEKTEAVIPELYRAIKKLDKTPISSHSTHTNGNYKKIMKEVYVISALQACPYIIQYFNCWIENIDETGVSILYIQTEYCKFGDLENKFLNNSFENDSNYIQNENGSIDVIELAIWVILNRIGSALHYMHQRGMAHLDIRPANIFIASNKCEEYDPLVNSPLLNMNPNSKSAMKSKSNSKPLGTNSSLTMNNTIANTATNGLLGVCEIVKKISYFLFINS